MGLLAQDLQREWVPTHVRCFECMSDTELDEGRRPDDVPCLTCDNQGKDPWLVEAVMMFKCPHGTRAEDWRPGYGFVNKDDSCLSDWHEPKSGMHVVSEADWEDAKNPPAPRTGLKKKKP